jgi:hypothetical protein
MYQSTVDDLNKLRTYWTNKRAEVADWPDHQEAGEGEEDGKAAKDDLLWRMDAAEFCAKKVIEKGLRLFKEQYDNHMNGNEDHPVLLGDLKGLWDRANISASRRSVACHLLCTFIVPHDYLLLDSVPNIGPLISSWELEKFKNC